MLVNILTHYLKGLALCSKCRFFLFVCFFSFTADAVHNAAGFGVSGVNERGEVSWDLISNVHIWEIEVCSLLFNSVFSPAFSNATEGLWISFHEL